MMRVARKTPDTIYGRHERQREDKTRSPEPKPFTGQYVTRTLKYFSSYYLKSYSNARDRIFHTENETNQSKI